MIPVLLAAAGGVISALAYPRFGPGVLIVPGIALFLAGLRRSPSRRIGLVSGLTYGLVFFTGLMSWSLELGLIALVPLVVLQSLFVVWFGWWLAGYAEISAGKWLVLAVSGWALMELVRYHFPFSGLEWGGAGYAVSDLSLVRLGATVVGASGWTVIVVAVAAGVALVWHEPRSRLVWGVFFLPVLVILVAAVPGVFVADDTGPPVAVAIVQGSTPCPYEKCPPDERLRTFEQHLELTRTIQPGEADLVVWAEGSTGSSNADPIQNPEIGAAIAAEAERIGAWFLVGSDRPISETEWINANVVFDDEGDIAGEYRKQQGVPFGEYIPFRPIFDGIPELSQVPRDMVPGKGPVIFPINDVVLGSVISFEGSFSRFARQHVNAGANTLIVATNEGSYGRTSVSDQLIGMTRMRAAELGVPVVHAAVTGKSVIIDRTGDFVSDISGLGTEEIVFGSLGASRATLYRSAGDWVMYLAVVIGAFMVWRQRRLLASSTENA